MKSGREAREKSLAKYFVHRVVHVYDVYLISGLRSVINIINSMSAHSKATFSPAVMKMQGGVLES